MKRVNRIMMIMMLICYWVKFKKKNILNSLNFLNFIQTYSFMYINESYDMNDFFPTMVEAMNFNSQK